MALVPGAALLWRGDHQHQVGIERPVRVDTAEASALESTRGEVPARLPALAGRLERAGLIAADRGPAPRIRVTGLWAAGVVAAETLARAGAALILVDPRLDDPGTAETGVLPALGGGSRAQRAARLLRDLQPDAAVGLDETRAVDAEVVVAPASLPPHTLHRLMIDDTPHAAVLTDERGATVIPVRPGVSPCVRCRDVERTRRDAAWPLLLRQCEPLAAVTDPATAAVAGGLAAAAALTLAGGEAAPTAWRVERGRPTPLPLEIDAGCGCAGAPGTAR